MAFQTPKTVEDVLKRIYAKDYLMPAIQREFIWDANRIIQLFDSLLRGYPLGSFLFWDVTPERAADYVFYGFLTDYHERDRPYAERTRVPPGGGTIAILDGQQRLTSLNIGLYGSHAPRRSGRGNWADPYPVKHLYLNLVDDPPEEELGLLYDLRFLTKAEVTGVQDAADKWFLVGDILRLDDDPVGYMDVVEGRGILDVREGVRRLVDLYKAIRKTPVMNYYLVEDQDPDRVLEIFIRVNSGGQPLGKSDLLLSMATNQWSTEPGAREEVRNLVSELNSRGFNFNKDFVLKSALMVVGADVRFQVSSITRGNIRKIETEWSTIRAVLLLAADILKQAGYSANTLTANNAAIVVAYYLSRLTPSQLSSYLESSHTAADRDLVVGWVTRSLLKQGVWGSGVDTLLTRVRAAIDQADVSKGFPVIEIEAAMTSLGKVLSFEEAEIESLLHLEYGGPRTFALLATLYPGLDLSKEFHEDHVYPRAIFNTKSLKGRGIPEDLIPAYLDAYNRLPNLQLLSGQRNNEKLAMSPADWVSQHFHSDAKRETYLAENDLDGLSLELANFLTFVDERGHRMRERLNELLKPAKAVGGS